MSIESLVLLTVFVLLPLFNWLRELMKERARTGAPGDATSDPTVATEVERKHRTPLTRRRTSAPSPTPAPVPPAAVRHPPRLRVDSRPATPAPLVAAVRSAIAPPMPAPPRRARHLDLRDPAAFREAMIAHTLLGPCRAARPYESGPDL